MKTKSDSIKLHEVYDVISHEENVYRWADKPNHANKLNKIKKVLKKIIHDLDNGQIVRL